MLYMPYDFFGKHIICDAYNINSSLFFDIPALLRVAKNGIEKSGATLINLLCHEFENGGFTLIALLKESHVSIHAYPEKRSLFLDAFTCGSSDPSIIIEEIIQYLNPQKVDQHIQERGSKDIAS